MSSFIKDWLTVSWTQGGMPLDSDGHCSTDSEYDSIKVRCGRAGSLATTPGERLMELLRPNVAIPRRHSTAACAPQSNLPHHHHHNTGFKYCPSDALPYCPPSGILPNIGYPSMKPQIQQPPPVPQRTIPPPPNIMTSPPTPPARKPPRQPVRILPPTPPRPSHNINIDRNGNPHTQKDTFCNRNGTQTAMKVDLNNLQRICSQSKIQDNRNYVLNRAQAPPPLIMNTSNIKRSPSVGSNKSIRQDSNVSSESFSQTSSPSYTTKTMEAPLLPHQHIKGKLTKSSFAAKEPSSYEGDPNKSITKSTSTPASLQTIVRLQNGSNVSFHHKMLRGIRDANTPKPFRIAQIMVNAIALLAIAGGLVGYYRAYPSVKYVTKIINTTMTIIPPPPDSMNNPAPGICLPVIVPFCHSKKVPYNFTIFPNYLGHFTQRDAQLDLEIFEAVVDVRCYELTAFFLCSIFVPKCGPLGHMVRPCKSLCQETMRRCGFFFDVFGLTMPGYLQCEIFPESTDTNVCLGHKEVREAKARAAKPVCPSGFQCDVRRCIPLDWRCDGHIDCYDQSDELNCRSCKQGKIHCGERKCIAATHMCDGKVDCPWGQDERNCLRLSDDNSDVGRGQLELFNPKGEVWEAACISYWDDKTTPNKLCTLLGYNKVNRSRLEGGWAPLERERKWSGKDRWKRAHMKDMALFKDLRSCTSHMPKINLLCQDYGCGRRRIHSMPSKRIIGGVEASPGDWPFIAAILGGPEEIFYCAGVLIADEWILTASHCAGNHTDVSGWTIQLGITRRKSHAYYGQKAKVKRVVTHPFYNIGIAHDNDIALFQLEKRVKYHEHLSPVCLPPKNKDLTPGTLCTVIGWGKSDDRDISEYEPAVHEVNVPVLSRELCNSWLEHRDLNVTEGMVCAGYSQGGKDACQGDSGGPLLCKDPDDDNRWFVGGIVSWGIKCAHPKLPGVYAYVPKYVPWIQQQIEQFTEIGAEQNKEPGDEFI